MILSGQSIWKRCIVDRLISPCSERSEAFAMTWGVGPAGYDVRVEFDADGVIDYLLLPPGGFTLTSTIERFSMPDDLIAFVHDKSSWARKGLAVQNTVIEPGWEGWLTLELTNHSDKDIILERGMPIAQIVFQQIDVPAIRYAGKYHHQGRGPQKAR